MGGASGRTRGFRRKTVKRAQQPDPKLALVGSWIPTLARHAAGCRGQPSGAQLSGVPSTG